MNTRNRPHVVQLIGVLFSHTSYWWWEPYWDLSQAQGHHIGSSIAKQLHSFSVTQNWLTSDWRFSSWRCCFRVMFIWRFCALAAASSRAFWSASCCFLRRILSRGVISFSLCSSDRRCRSLRWYFFALSRNYKTREITVSLAVWFASPVIKVCSSKMKLAPTTVFHNFCAF